MGSWISVNSVVSDYIGEAELSNNQFYKLWQIAFRGMSDLGLDFFYEVKTVRIPLNPNGTATLPPNINWIKVGVFDFAGGFMPLDYNKTLNSYASLNPNRKTLNDSNGGVLNGLDTLYSLSTPYFYNYGSSFLCGNSWLGGSFNVDEKAGIILFDNWTNISDVAVEIMCAPQAGEEYYIPLVFREALLEWIGWRDIKHLPNGRRSNSGKIAERKNDYYNARRLAAQRYTPFIMQNTF